MASPAAMIGMSPNQSSPANVASPSGPYENGRGVKRSNTALSVDVDATMSDNMEMTPTTASSTGKKKLSGKKPGRPKKGTVPVKEEFVVPSTPTGPGTSTQPQELQYDPGQNQNNMERSGTSDSNAHVPMNGEANIQENHPNGDQSTQSTTQQQQQTLSTFDPNDDLMKSFWDGNMDNGNSGLDMQGSVSNDNIFDDFDFTTVSVSFFLKSWR